MAAAAVISLCQRGLTGAAGSGLPMCRSDLALGESATISLCQRGLMTGWGEDAELGELAMISLCQQSAPVAPVALPARGSVSCRHRTACHKDRT